MRTVARSDNLLTVAGGDRQNSFFKSDKIVCALVYIVLLQTLFLRLTRGLYSIRMGRTAASTK